MSKMIKICREEGCKNAETARGYCRLHYLKNWKKVKSEEKRKSAERLNRYVEGVCKRFPDKYIDEIKKEIRSGRLVDAIGDEEGVEDRDLMHDLGLDNDDRLDKIVGTIKIDKDFL